MFGWLSLLAHCKPLYRLAKLFIRACSFTKNQCLNQEGLMEHELPEVLLGYLTTMAQQLVSKTFAENSKWFYDPLKW